MQATERPTYVRINGRDYAQWSYGYVYFAQPINGRPILKVGWSQNPWYRMIAIAGEWRIKLKLYHTIKIKRGHPYWGTWFNSLEQIIHRRLARYRINTHTFASTKKGEWYSLSGGYLYDEVREIGWDYVKPHPADLEPWGE